MTIRFALLGAGRIGKVHAKAITANPGARLVAVADAVEKAASDIAAQYGCEVRTIAQILTSADIDAVVICTPTDTHADLIEQFSTAKKAIFCEKPIDLSLDRVRACATAVQDAGIACMIGFQRRFDPTFNEARTRMDRGDIGEPEMLIVTSRDPGAPPLDYIRGSGGIFRDMLIHDFDIFRWILCADGDQPQWLSAAGSVLTDPAIAGADDFDSTAVTIRTRKGRLCQINTIRRAAYGYDQRFEVLGSAGMLQCGNQHPSEVALWNADGILRDKPEHFFLQRYAAAYRLEIAHFFECLQSGAAFRTTVADGLAAQELADAAAHSAKTGLPVTW